MKKSLIFLSFLILGIGLNILPVPRDYLPYIGNVDANTYIEMSREVDLQELNKLGFFEFLLGALNWLSLPLLLKIIDIENGYWKMMIINAIILYGIIAQLNILSRGTRLSNTVFITLCLLLMPYLWCWIFVPSKENITVLGFLILFNGYQQAKSNRMIPVALALGVFKTQLIMGFVVTEVLKRVKRHYFLFSLLAVNIITIFIYKVFEEALSVELYLSHTDETINSSGLILIIESLLKTPIIGMLGVLIRLLLYFIGGISAIKNMFGSFESFLMNFSSINVGLLSLVFLVFIRQMDKKELKIFWSLILVFLFVPFIQFRYFWWTIPVLLFFICRMKKEQEVSNSEPVAELTIV